MSWKKTRQWLLSLTGLATVLFLSFLAYYYVTTPSAALVVSCEDFPASLSVPFSPDALIDRVTSHLEDVISTANSPVTSEMGRWEGLGPRTVQQRVLPIRASSSVPSPVFNEKWKNVNLNLARRLGLFLRTKELLELRLVGAPQGGWRVLATYKERPVYSPREMGSAPLGGGACSDLESCANDLAEQILRRLDYERLLNYYIKLDTESSNRQILDLYQNIVPANTLQADDLVAWGNAFFAVHRFDDALEKYQAALEKADYCPGHIARGVLFNNRIHGSQLLTDLHRAEDDLRKGVACDQTNKFAHINLCSVLIREWVRSPNHVAGSLDEAEKHCKRTLDLDSHFVAAEVEIGYVQYREGKRQETLKYFEDLSAKYPKNSSLFANYSFLLYLDYLDGNRDALPLAIEKARKAFELDPSNYASANNLGFFYYEQKDYSDALLYWQKADPLRGEDADSTAGIALALWQLHREPEALVALAKAVRADPHYGDPEFLQKNANWSKQAAADLAGLIPKLSTSPAATVF